ncbi:MAG: hypothetical protein ACP5VC_14275 [Bryobacteraceae bacterium]
MKLIRFDSPDRLVTWEAAGEECRIVVPEPLLESIRRECVLAARGPVALGMGGALLGEASGGTYRIRAWHPIPCRHQRGPSFLLSKEEVAGLKEFLSRLPAEAGAAGDQIIGWFVSHPHTGAALRDDEISLHQRFFRSRDLFLLMEIDSGGAAEITVHRGAAPLQPRWRVMPLPSSRGGASPAGQSQGGKADAGAGRASGGEATPGSPAGRKWLAAASVAMILGSAGYLGWEVRQARRQASAVQAAPVLPPLTTFSLSVEKQPGGFLIRWNPDAAALTRAARVALQIEEGGQRQEVTLEPPVLRSGRYLHASSAGVVEVEMTAEPRDGAVSRERVRYQP